MPVGVGGVKESFEYLFNEVSEFVRFTYDTLTHTHVHIITLYLRYIYATNMGMHELAAW